MGDSTTLTDLNISHCYKRRARYQVVLDVLVPATGEVRQAEKTFEVDLVTQPVINFSFPTTVHVGQAIAFDSPDSGLPTCQNIAYIWDFRDGTTQQGHRIEHTFVGRAATRCALAYGAMAQATAPLVTAPPRKW
jgi:hypothetical protein